MSVNFEEKFWFISENARDLITIMNDKFEIEYVNSLHLSKMLGYSTSEVIGKIGVKFIHPDDVKKVLKVFKKGLKITEGTLEGRIIHKDGHYIWCEANGKSFRDKEGNLKILIIIRDITEKKIAEQKLKESEEKYRTIIENTKDAIVILGLDGKYKYISPQLSTMLGGREINPEDDLFGLIHPDERKNVLDLYSKAIRQKSTQNIVVECRLLHKDGHYIWILTSSQNYYDDEGNMGGFIASLRDITNRKIAEQKVKESEEKFRSLYESSPNAILLLNMKGEILDCNWATEKLSGFKKNDLVGKHFLDIAAIPEKYVHIIMKDLKALLKGEIPEQREMQLLTKEGTPTWVNCQVSLVILGDENLLHVIIQDITEKKIHENLIKKQNKKLTELDRIKTELMRRTSHELKTPLISIKGFSDLLLTMHYEKLDEETIDIIKEIKQGCERLEILVRDILISSKLESDEIKLNLLEEDLAFLIRFCVNELKMFAKMRNQTISLDLPEKLIAKFEKEKIYDVVTNLLSNAIKYSPPNSDIMVQSEIKDGFVVISIEDDGIGFTKEEKEKIFQQFGKIERYGQGIEVDSNGTGLGLYIAKKMVDLHGGKIWVESEGRNKGSTFYFSLPLLK